MILAIDLAVIAIIAFCVWRGYKNGLIRGVFGVVALIASLLIANIAAKVYSEEFTGMLQPFVGGVVDTTLADILDGNVSYDMDVSKRESKEFATAYAALRHIGLPEAAAVRVAEMASQSDDPDASLSDIISDKLSSTLAFVAVFGIGFILLSIVFAVIGNLIGFVFSLPGLRILDIAAGVVFGFFRGLIIVLTLATIVRYFGLLARETLEETRFLNHIVNNNMIANMLGL